MTRTYGTAALMLYSVFLRRLRAPGHTPEQRKALFESFEMMYAAHSAQEHWEPKSCRRS